MASNALSSLPPSALDRPSPAKRVVPPHHRRHRTIADRLFYYSVFITLFVLALPVCALLRVAGRPMEGGVIAAAKRAADGPAGYAVQC